MVYRHPFPGPGLGVRVLGEVRKEYCDILRQADAIFIEELHRAGKYHEVSQAFAVFLPVRSVGVVGDARRYAYVVNLRAVETIDFMTARRGSIQKLLEHNRIMNEIPDGLSMISPASHRNYRVGVMMPLKISTYSSRFRDKSYLMTPALLNYVVAGLMKFHPIEPNFFPSKWVEGSSL